MLLFSPAGMISSAPAEAAYTYPWGIIIGKNLYAGNPRMKKYRTLVVDVQYYYPNEVSALKSGGRRVYSYMSIGSLETYRPYYRRFKNHTFSRYKNWDDELWMDVSYKPWQDFIVNELVASVRRKGCDGLWLDNFDVYEKYHRESVYKGLLSILIRLKKKNIPVYLNGGDQFVSRLIKSGKGKLIKGVFQEEVFTRILSYGGNRFGKQTKSEQAYFEAYLKRVKKAGLTATVLEYTNSTDMKNKIIRYCMKNKYSYYISNDVHLR